MIKRKIFLLTLILITVCFSFSTVSAFAYYSNYISWNSADASYSPSTGDAQVFTYPDSTPGYQYDDIYMHSNFTYTSSAITSIANYYNNNTYYPGIDITEMSNIHIGATGFYATNLPNPHFDTDDDDWNSSSEESEIVSCSPLSMTANTGYYFNVDFYEVVYGNYAGYFAITAHESRHEWYDFSEYNTVYYDELATIHYETPNY